MAKSKETRLANSMGFATHLLMYLDLPMEKYSDSSMVKNWTMAKYLKKAKY
jgi:hypothetical protein